MANVPIAPGVPAVPGATAQTAVLLTADAVSIVSAFTGPQWGIFLNNVQVVGQGLSGILSAVTGLSNGNFMDMDYKVRFNISNYPQEQGAFQSYNIVQTPYDVGVTITAGGSNAARATLLSQVQSIMGTTNLYTVIMPEGSLVSLNPVAYGYRRTHEDGLGLLIVHILFQQVRPAGDPTFSTTSSASSTAAAAPSTGGPPPITNPTTGFVSSTSPIALGVVSAIQAGNSTISSVLAGV